MNRYLYNTRSEQVESEDLILFINTCLTCTRQTEFYENQFNQELSVNFVHEYILANYRSLYALTLASGINDFNKALIVQNLLSAGSPDCSKEKEEEALLINKALSSLPVNRVFKLFKQLQKHRINNRRTRAIIKNYISARENHAFDAIKYKSKLQDISRHAHIDWQTEVGHFLFNKKYKQYQNHLFKTYMEAHYSHQAVYRLPYSIAEGFAKKHGIKKSTFLKKIEPNLTKKERLRIQNSVEKEKLTISLDFSKVNYTPLMIYWLSLDKKQRSVLKNKFLLSLDYHANLFKERLRLQNTSIALVLDRSYSMSGSSEKKRRPLAIAFGIFHLLKRLAKSCHTFWSTQVTDENYVSAHGQSNIASPLVNALSTGADTIIIVSDGFENDVTGMTAMVYKLWKKHLCKENSQRVLHINPCYNAENFDVKKLSDDITTVGIRNVEDLPTILKYSLFADGSYSQTEFEEYLRKQLYKRK